MIFLMFIMILAIFLAVFGRIIGDAMRSLIQIAAICCLALFILTIAGRIIDVLF